MEIALLKIAPNRDRIKDFAKLIASSLPHMKLLQLDIAVDADGNLRLLEYNINGFSIWMAQFTGTPAFGKYTDEIRRYALSKKCRLKLFLHNTELMASNTKIK